MKISPERSKVEEIGALSNGSVFGWYKKRAEQPSEMEITGIPAAMLVS